MRQRKLPVLTEGGVAGFWARGLGELEALVAAQMTGGVLDVAVTRWLMLEPKSHCPSRWTHIAGIWVLLCVA